MSNNLIKQINEIGINIKHSKKSEMINNILKGAK